MPNEGDVLLNFIGDTSRLVPVETAMEQIVSQAGEVGAAWEKATDKMDASTKTSITSTNKLAKSIEAMAVAAKSMDKVAIGGAYKDYLKQIQTALGLTNKELINYIQTARKAAQQRILAVETDKEIDEITLSIEAMNEQLALLGAGEDEVGNKTQSLRARLREAKEELVAMAEAGLQNTPAFAELQQKAGELDDQMKDLNAEISTIGSDTKNIDGLIGLASGLAGGFAVAQGAAALFGAGEEEIQKALLKVNAAMAILQGLQQIQIVLQKESAAMKLLDTINTQALAVSNKILAAATIQSAAATGVLRTALIASGIGAFVLVLGLAINALDKMGDKAAEDAEKIKKLNESAEAYYESYQKFADVNQNRINREIDLTKNKAEIDLLKAKGASIATINGLEKKNLDLETTSLKVQLMGLEQAKSIAADKSLFVTQELDLKRKIYENDQAQLLLDLETNKTLNERALKSASAFADAEVARKKLVIVKSQVDSIASIKAVSDAEVAAIRRKQAEELKSSSGLTPGEIAKINADADLAVAENKKALSQELLKIDTAGIEARLLLTKKGSEDEYNAKLALLEKEKATALSNNQVTANDKLKIEADYITKKRDLDRAYEESKMTDEISYLNTYIDEFGTSEDRKLELTIRRINKQRDLEISQAEGNAAKIKEIDAKYDTTIRETKKAKLVAELQDRLNVLDTYGALEKASNEKVANAEKSTFDQRKAARLNLLNTEISRLDLEQDALDAQLSGNLILQKDYDVALRALNNQRAEATQKTEEEITADTLREIQKRTNAIQATFSIFQEGLSATMDTSVLTVALTELQNFGTAAQDIFEKIKLKTINTTEGIKQISGLAIGAMQAITNQSFADAAASRQQALADTLSALEDQKNKELENKALTEDQKAAIDKKYREKERQEKIRAFIADKEAKKEQAIINGLLAVTNALATAPTIIAGLILAAVVAASTAIQVNKINNTKVPKFRHGKVGIEGPGTTTSDSIPAMISRGESVINADATSKWKDALKAINNNKFESYLHDKMLGFAFPHVGEHVKPSSGNSIDYEKLSTMIADKMKGVIPGEKSIQVINDANGQRVFVVESNNRTEYKNKRYSMTE